MFAASTTSDKRSVILNIPKEEVSSIVETMQKEWDDAERGLRILTLEEAIEFLAEDELMEVTPKSIRLRKKILNTDLRMKEMMRIRRALQGNK